MFSERLDDIGVDCGLKLSSRDENDGWLGIASG